MRCDAFEELIDGADLTAEEEQAQLALHAQECPRCREELNKSRRLHSLVCRAFSFSPDQTYWDGYHATVKVCTKVQSIAAPEPSLWQRWKSLMTWPVVGEMPAFLIPLLTVGMAVAGVLWWLDR